MTSTSDPTMGTQQQQQFIPGDLESTRPIEVDTAFSSRHDYGAMGHPTRRLVLLDKPHRNDVCVGRGRAIQSSPGNLRFQAIINSFLPEYAKARLDKRQKTHIIHQVLERVMSMDENDHPSGSSRSPPSAHGFVKRDRASGKWMVCEIATAKGTIAQAFRDALKGKYRSSREFKKERRQYRPEMGAAATGTSSLQDLKLDAADRDGPQRFGAPDSEMQQLETGCPKPVAIRTVTPDSLPQDDQRADQTLLSTREIDMLLEFFLKSRTTTSDVSFRDPLEPTPVAEDKMVVVNRYLH
jgi:hypothetical protein